MAEKYCARNNNGEEMPQKTKKELGKEATSEMVEAVAPTVANAIVPGSGEVVKAVGKTELGKQIYKKAGDMLGENPFVAHNARIMKKIGGIKVAKKALNDINNPSSSTSEPVDNITNESSSDSIENSVNKSNILNINSEIDKTEQKANAKNLSFANNVASRLSSKFSDNKFLNDLSAGLSAHEKERNDAKKKLKLLKAKKRKLLIIYGGVFFFFILMMTMIVAAKDFGNLDLTNKSTSIIGTGGARNCTNEELESSLVYVGDSRIVGMESTLGSENINYIAETGQGYTWLKNTASSQIDTVIQNDPDSVIVLGLGVNDLHNGDNYISYYNELMDKYPDNKFFVMSVNPVNDSLASSNGYTVTNAEIDSFNQKLRSAFEENYIDSNSTLSNIGTSDGIHYDSDTNKNIHDSVISNINSSGKVKCGAAGNLSVSLETVAMWYIENVNTYQKSTSGKGTGARKYYETPFGSRKFGDDCTEFVAAYMSFISGQDIPESYSGGMIDPNGSWAKQVASAGWKAYSSDEIGELQFGDILIAHKGLLYSTKGYHGEVYISETETFGWGSIKKSYPTSNTITRSVEGSHVHFRDSGHDYVTIYRFSGA